MFTTLIYSLIYAAVKTDLIAGTVCAYFITPNMFGHMSDPSDFQAQGGIPQKSRKIKFKKVEIKVYFHLLFKCKEMREAAPS